MVNRLRDIFAIGQVVKDNFGIEVKRSRTFLQMKVWNGQTVNSLFAVWSSGHGQAAKLTVKIS